MKTQSAILINADSPIKEFAEEQEPEERKCLFCDASVPVNLPTRNMQEMKKGLWYSNALLNLDTRKIWRFYICPDDICHIPEAWEQMRGRNNGTKQ